MKAGANGCFKDEFLATTSHELKMPLHGINGLAEFLVGRDKATVG